MKQLIALLIVWAFVLEGAFSQAPQAFKYQAVIRDTTGNVVPDQLVSLKISVLKGAVDGEIMYEEIHDVSTNTLGLVNLEIGRGLVLSGVFGDIPWGDDSFFIQIAIDLTGGMDYQLLGTSQLLSVPYALYAETAGNQVLPSEELWQETQGGIFYNEGHVGVGTENPESNLHIVGASEYTSNRRFLQISNSSTDDLSASVLWMNAGQKTSSTFLSHHASTYSLYDGKYAATSQLWNDGNGLFFRTRPESKFIFETYDGGQYSIPVEVMRITGDGKVGIGTENPEFPLEIAGESDYLGARTYLALKNYATDISSSVDLRLYAGMGDDWMGLFHCGEDYSIFDIYAKTSIVWNNGNGLIIRTKPSGRISFETTVENGDAVVEHMRMTGDGKFGIGTTDPQRTLHVDDVMRLEPRSSAPDNPSEGDIYMDGNDHKLKVYDGTAWRECW